MSDIDVDAGNERPVTLESKIAVLSTLEMTETSALRTAKQTSCEDINI